MLWTPLSYDKQFVELYYHLKSKYGEELFELEGIGTNNLDYPLYARKFFKGDKKPVADHSVDSNANISDKPNVTNFIAESTKSLNKLNSLFIIWNEAKKLYNTKIANDLIESAIVGDIYINDAVNGGLQPYCFNFSTLKVATKGLPNVNKIHSEPPKHIKSFVGQLLNFICLASNQILGATGIADFLLTLSIYVDKMIKNNYSDSHIKFNSEDDAWNYIKETITEFIYNVNQNYRTSIQSPFSNVSLYDKYFLADIIEDYKLIIDNELYEANVDIVKKVQEIYCECYNEILNRTPCTFPVTTSCHAIDENHEVKDLDFLKFIAKTNKKYGFINIYNGDSSTLSSCCFGGDTLVTYKFNIDEEARIGTIKDVVNHCIANEHDIYLPQFTNRYVLAKPVKLRKLNKKMYRITFETTMYIDCTEDHFHPFKYDAIDKKTTELKIGDILPSFNFNYSSENKENVICIEGYKSDYQDSYSRIADIKEIEYDDEYVYCFEIDNQNWPYFILANGIFTHNCRLRSDKNNSYFNSIGGTSSEIGSMGVCTINMPRLAFKYKHDINEFFTQLKEKCYKAQRINNAKRSILKRLIDKNYLPLYTEGFMSLDKQFCTIGINGLYEAMEILGYDVLTDTGLEFQIKVIDFINKENEKISAQFNIPTNLEQIPGESVSVKLAQKDAMFGYNNKYEIYSNQFIPLTVETNMLNRIKLNGAMDKHFSGGSIMHLNIGETIENESDLFELYKYIISSGTVYFAINYVLMRCVNNHMTVGDKDTTKCNICNGDIVNKFTRIVGFLTSIDTWNSTRKNKDFPHRKFYNTIKI